MAIPITTRLLLQNTARSALGRMTLAGYIKNSKGPPERPMRILGSYALVYLLEGEGRFRDANTSVNVTAGDLLVLFPDVPHTYGPGPGQTWSEIYVVFDGPIFDLWRDEGLLDPGRCVLHVEPISYWVKRIEETVRGGAGATGGTTPQQVCLLQHVLADVLEVARQREKADEDEAWLGRARDRLRASAAGEASAVEQIASELGMSYENFRKRFARLAGVPPMRYRMQCVIESVCHLLQQRELPLRTVAKRCGFCDEFHLSRRFKQMMGVSPSDFRRQLGWSTGMKDEG